MSVYCVYYEVDWLLTLCVEGWRGRSSQLGGVVAGSEAQHGHRNGRWRGESNRDVYCLVSAGRVPAGGELVAGRLDWREQKQHARDYYTDGHSASARGQSHRLLDPVSLYIVLPGAPGCRIQIMIVGLPAQAMRAVRKKRLRVGDFLGKGRGLGEMVIVRGKE